MYELGTPVHLSQAAKDAGYPGPFDGGTIERRGPCKESVDGMRYYVSGPNYWYTAQDLTPLGPVHRKRQPDLFANPISLLDHDDDRAADATVSFRGATFCLGDLDAASRREIACSIARAYRRNWGRQNAKD